MPRSRFTEEKIIRILNESEAGAKTAELCRRHGVSNQTFYLWRKKYGGMDVSDVASIVTSTADIWMIENFDPDAN